MATISPTSGSPTTGTMSSLGVGSGLDVNSIISKLVDLEKQPLKTLQLKATNVQSQISAFGTIQSEVSALTDLATKISDPGTWVARNANSSNTGAATITVTSTAPAGSYTLNVDAVAQSQSVTSSDITTGSALGAGTLTLQLGNWSSGGAAFTPASGSSAMSVSISATDTVATIAGKINAAGAGVVATAFNDGTGDRLLLRSQNTGVANGFRVQSADPALAPLVFDPQNKAGSGMASVGNPVQYGQDAKARINGIAVTSASNTLSSNISGVTINLLSATTTGYGTPSQTDAPVSLSVSEDVTSAVKNVQDFVTAYNKLATDLANQTKYDATTQTAAIFQGDATVTGLQNILGNMVGSISQGAGSYKYLSDAGIQVQLDGTLTIDTARLSVAANDGTSLQKLFTGNNNNPLTNGFALKFASLGKGLLSSGGTVTTEAAALKAQLDQNTADQAAVNARASKVQARLTAQYSALDGRMASLNALSAYVTQQVTLWNKSTTTGSG
jgi:flagellar hook-associated protein 2